MLPAYKMHRRAGNWSVNMHFIHATGTEQTAAALCCCMLLHIKPPLPLTVINSIIVISAHAAWNEMFSLRRCTQNIHQYDRRSLHVWEEIPIRVLLLQLMMMMLQVHFVCAQRHNINVVVHSTQSTCTFYMCFSRCSSRSWSRRLIYNRSIGGSGKLNTLIVEIAAWSSELLVSEQRADKCNYGF